MRYRHTSQRYLDYSQTDQRLRAGLVGHWMGDGAGLILRDRSGRLNDGIFVNNPTWKLGQGNKRHALFFDGLLAYVNCGNNISIQLSTTITVSAWINTTNVLVSYQSIISKEYNYGIFTSGGNFVAYDWGGNVGIDSGVSVADGRWHHVAYTFTNGVSSGSFLYVDGILRTTGTTTIVPNGEPYRECTIGWNPGAGAGNQQFNGFIEEVRVYNRVLSDAEIALLANPSFLPIIQTGRRSLLLNAILVRPYSRFFFGC